MDQEWQVNIELYCLLDLMENNRPVCLWYGVQIFQIIKSKLKISYLGTDRGISKCSGFTVNAIFL
jgi:hypothetical protein